MCNNVHLTKIIYSQTFVVKYTLLYNYYTGVQYCAFNKMYIPVILLLNTQYYAISIQMFNIVHLTNNTCNFVVKYATLYNKYASACDCVFDN